MKTFKLKSLEIIENQGENIHEKIIPLIDGLIINREDEENQWIIEAYVEQEHLYYFEQLREENDEIMIRVKITKESNDPAIFITSIIGLNRIGTQMNVLFKGNILDQRNSKIEQMLKTLIEEEYQGEELLAKFKQLIGAK
jgi:hypothetical protein